MAKIGKEVLDKIWAEIEDSSISNEVVTATLMSNALDIMLRDIDKRIVAIYRANGIKAEALNGDHILTGMARYSKAIKTALYWFERDIEPRVTECTFGSDGGIKAYDDFRYSANEVCQLIMLAVDRGKIDGAMERIFKYMTRLKQGGRFSKEDIERFIMK
nr:MAG TPA: hypothetical protein [Caudoviricetes sp.]